MDACGIRTVDDTHSNFLSLCPFHGNNDTPSFTVSKEQGLYHCFNPSCGVSGSLPELVMKIKGMTVFAALRLISKAKTETALSFEERLAREMEPEVDWAPFDTEILAKCYDGFWKTDKAVEYMRGRGFADETLEYFRIGYSAKRDSIMVPMHSPEGLPIGVIGRSLEGKSFKNSKGLPKNKTAWNYHRAKREGDTVIICEASFDAMRIHQAGYRNVVALLGGNFSKTQEQQLARAFNTVVLMVDYDDKTKHMYKTCNECKRAGSPLCRGHNPGEKLGATIAERMKGKKVLWGHHGGITRFPPGVKDAGDMTDTQIRHVISNAISNVEYVLEA